MDSLDTSGGEGGLPRGPSEELSRQKSGAGLYGVPWTRHEPLESNDVLRNNVTRFRGVGEL